MTVDLGKTGPQNTVGAGVDELSGIGNLIGSGFDDALTGDGLANLLDGGDGDDFLIGGADNDTLNGGIDDDLFEGGDGNDALNGGAGDDRASYLTALTGVTVSLAVATAQDTKGAGKDTLSQIENLDGSIFNDTLTGNGTANSLYGDDGDDLLNGGAGNDTLDGGDDSDTVVYASAAGAVTVDLDAGLATGAAGIDTLIAIENATGSNFNDKLTGDDVVNTLSGGTGNDTLDGGDGNDTLNGGAGSDTIIGGEGDDTLDGGTGTDTASYALSVQGVIADLAAGFADDGAGVDSLIAIENLLGSGLEDLLIGSKASNRLDGGAGDDVLIGGLGADKLFGGIGNDGVDYSASAAAVTVRLASVAAQKGGDAAGDTLSSIESAIGTDFNDALTGSASENLLVGGNGNDSLNGGTGNDVLLGGDGNDSLTGGPGADTLVGGLGNDVASYAASTVAVTVDLLAGAGTGGDAAGDTLVEIERLLGSKFADTLSGDAGDNTLEGGLGNDTLDGKGGNDTASYASAASKVTVDLLAGKSSGGAGADTLSDIDNVMGTAFNDVLNGDINDNALTGGKGNDALNGGGGNDTAAYDTATAGVTVDLSKAGAQNTVGAGTDTLSSIENLLGSAFNDKLTGDAGANTIMGGAGNDTIEGRAGADTLDGGDGIDTLSYVHDMTGVTVDLDVGAGFSGEAAGDVFSNFENVTSGSNDDQLVGDAGNNRLDGGAGNDALIGGAGADVLIGGAGNSDFALYLGATGVTVDLSTGKGEGGEAEGDTLSGIEDLFGTIANDVLTADIADNSLAGDNGDDKLSGGAGNDILNGEQDNDALIGGAGNDQLLGGTENDVLIGGTGADALDGGDDFDTASYAGSAVKVTVSLAAGTGSGGDAQGDTLTDVEAVIGSQFNDTLTGDGGDNTLEGGNGNDILTGGGGNDTASYASAAAGVTVDLTILVAQNTVGAGTDTLAGIENLIGSHFHDKLTGDGNANVLEGGAGNDTLDGGGGNDTASYAGASVGVTVDLSIAGPQNTIGAGVDTLISIEHLTGSSFGDRLIGDGGDNRLGGGFGNDTMDGGSGDDVFVFDAGFGNDVITGFTDGEDKVDFDDALFATAVDVVAAAVNDGGDTLITFDAGNTVRLVGFNVANFDTGDVLLH